MKYKPTIIDEASGVEIPNPKYEAYMDGIRESTGFFQTFIFSKANGIKMLIPPVTYYQKLKEWGIE